MTESVDRSARPLARAVREPTFSGGARDHLAALRGRNLGACAACGQSVFFEHNFTRHAGRVAHVRCPIGYAAHH